MSRTQRWIVVSAVGIGAFALIWWLTENVFAMDRGTAQALAGLAVALITVPAGWWFAQEQKPAPAPTTVDTPSRPARRWLPTIVVTLAILVVGIGGLQFLDRPKDGTTGQPPPGSSSPSGPANARSVTVGKTVWYDGLKVTVTTASYDPDKNVVTAGLQLENQSATDFSTGNMDVHLKTGDRTYTGGTGTSNSVLGRSSASSVLTFVVNGFTGDLTTAQIIFGRGDQVQAVVPLGEGTLVANEPKTVISGHKLTASQVTVTFTTCELRGDYLGALREAGQADHGQYVLGCTFNAVYTGTFAGGHYFGAEKLRLILPDGTTVSPAHPAVQLLNPSVPVTGVYAGFTFPWPAPGSYVLQLVDRNDASDPVTADNSASISFTVDATA
jgi:hypothetical protein